MSGDLGDGANDRRESLQMVKIKSVIQTGFNSPLSVAISLGVSKQGVNKGRDGRFLASKGREYLENTKSQMSV